MKYYAFCGSSFEQLETCLINKLLNQLDTQTN